MSQFWGNPTANKLKSRGKEGGKTPQPPTEKRGTSLTMSNENLRGRGPRKKVEGRGCPAAFKQGSESLKKKKQ